MGDVVLQVEDVAGNTVTYLVDNSDCTELQNDEKSTTALCKFDPQFRQAQFYQKSNKVFVFLDSHLLEKFLIEIKDSRIYRNAWLSNVWNLHKGVNRIYVYEILPQKPYIDYACGRKLEYLAREKQELDNMMSWLSTLGGAFSALGEEMTKCAKMAGRISLQQFKLATRLGDPDVQSRCRLYLALSLIQLGNLKLAKSIIQKEYQQAISIPEDYRDIRLVRMCQGIWARLKYEHSLKVAKRKATRNNLNS